MQRTLRTSFQLAGLCAVLVAAAPALAQGPAAPAESASAASASASAASGAARAGAIPNRRVIEDDSVRVEETRVRGQLQRVTVHSKTTGKDYDVLVGPPGRDPSQKRDAAGNAAWSLFSF